MADQSKYYELCQETENIFMKCFNKKAIPFKLGLQFVGCDQKMLIKISKLPDQYSFLLNNDLLISINDKLMSVFDDESIQILMEQEIDKISINMDNGKIKMVKPDLTTFSSLINKYGIDKITKANQVQELYSEQKQDAEEDFLV